MNNHQLQRQLIYLAALLHDIGKFYQRYATIKKLKLPKDIENLKRIYLPHDNQGRFSHIHSLWTAYFINKHKKKINKILGLLSDDDGLMTLAASHHSPNQNDIRAYIIQLADKLSSAERKPYEKDETNLSKFTQIPLYSIFQSIKVENYHIQDKQAFVKTQPLDISCLPIETSSNYQPDYILWEKFEDEFTNIPNILSANNFIQTLEALLHKYCYCIPSSTIDYPDISLYDHSKISAAIAIALYDYALENELSSFTEFKSDCKPLALLGCDISGIQDFIYDIPNKGAAKQLKGRSFYINLISEIIARYILKKFHLLRLNLIYNSGGNFYILLPNSRDIFEKVTDIKKEINKLLLQTHATELYFAIDYEEIAIENLLYGTEENFNTLGHLWNHLISIKLTKEKNQRYLDQLINNYQYFFEPKYPELPKQIEQTAEFLGNKLKNTKYLVFTESKLPNIVDDYYITFGVGIHVYLFEDFPDEVENAEVVFLNNTNFLILNEKKLNNNTYRFDFYGGNDYPSHNGNIKTFEELSEGKNFDRLGVVRMDVDSLGKIFAQGFSPAEQSFSRLAALSRSMDFFFKGYINTIWSKKSYKDYCYILYSGGDDVFLVGRWDKVLEFAKDLRSEFANYVQNPFFTLSGGLAIVKPKYPIRRAGILAGTMEEMAKDFSISQDIVDNRFIPPYTKNAFTIFKMPFSWQSDIEKIFEIAKVIKDKLEKEQISHSLLTKLKIFYLMYVYQKNKNATPSWKWICAYHLQKSAKQYSAAEKFINEIKISIFTDRFHFNDKNENLNSNYSFLQLLAIAIQLAEYQIKTESNVKL